MNDSHRWLEGLWLILFFCVQDPKAFSLTLKKKILKTHTQAIQDRDENRFEDTLHWMHVVRNEFKQLMKTSYILRMKTCF